MSLLVKKKKKKMMKGFLAVYPLNGETLSKYLRKYFSTHTQGGGQPTRPFLLWRVEKVVYYFS